jgi:hypothetical protein
MLAMVVSDAEEKARVAGSLSSSTPLSWLYISVRIARGEVQNGVWNFPYLHSRAFTEEDFHREVGGSQERG